MKKIIFCIIIIISIIYIYIFKNKKSNIEFFIGNNVHNKYVYSYIDTKIEDIIDDIDDNIVINDRTIQNILIKSNNIYLDLNNLILNKNSFNQIDILLKKIRLYSKEKIIVILRKDNKDSIDNKMNNWIFKLKDKYDIIIKR